MPRIFDNIEMQLLGALKETIGLSNRSDFCVGFFNLRGWKAIDSAIEHYKGGIGNCVRLLIGMQKPPADELRASYSMIKNDEEMDNQTAMKLKRKLAQEFRDQLTFGIPTNDDEAGLRRLANQIRAKKVVVKLFLRHQLHAKLYLLHRPDPNIPIVGYLGSSNLTMAGLSKQGEMNIDVLDSDASKKLSDWFEDRWNDKWCIDISEELVKIIEEGWPGEKLIPPYYIYLKMAYHLSQEARAGLQEFKIPKEFRNKLLEFQTAAVKIAAHHINKRGGAIIGDVVGLGKTIMATAVAKVFEDDRDWETLIICPVNLVPMWEDYRTEYALRAKVIPISMVQKELPGLRRYRLVIIDESHNLRNRDGKRYKAIQEYLIENDSKVIMLSATPYNKTYLDLSNQLRLFIEEDADMGIRPERLLRDIGETEFLRLHQCPVRSLAAFEKSGYPDDWRELMRLYLVRRTRTFIMDNYSKLDSETNRRYLPFQDGSKQFFPARVPRTLKYDLKGANDQYSVLYSQEVVDTINALSLPRYGLGNYIDEGATNHPTKEEERILKNLQTAGSRLRGFCRTSLFKRLESCGFAFIESLKRHILRNYVYLHAIRNKLPLPIGPQGVELLDLMSGDEDLESELFDDDGKKDVGGKMEGSKLASLDEFKKKAAEIYKIYSTAEKKKFRWIRTDLFVNELHDDLLNDSQFLFGILKKCGEWKADNDSKVKRLYELLQSTHSTKKVIVFTQFADTADYLEKELQRRGIQNLVAVTGDSSDPTKIAYRFSPVSNNRRNQIPSSNELRVLIATDVLSEGQNLQDCAIVVNFDLPWAIVRLIQRVGRIDRIGQTADEILCYSFMPAEGVEDILRLRARLRSRLEQNKEVLGSDEAFFEDEAAKAKIVDLYNEKSGVLDDDPDSEIDLTSHALQIWKNAIAKDKELAKIIPNLQPVVYSTREVVPADKFPEGVLLYLKTSEGTDALAWVDKNGNPVTESQIAILKAAECKEDTPAIARTEKHHDLVKAGVERIVKEEKQIGGQLGSPRGARFRVYERLKNYVQSSSGSLFSEGSLFYDQLSRVLQEIYKHPLRQVAADTFNRQLKAGISDDDLAQLVLSLKDDGRLCKIDEDEIQENPEPLIICSMGLFKK